ncbi:signal recognition particle-docking protein FtsY [Thiorhodococcus drewsii AZ1]|uniref:Signal recognition particle receptor FtsY n=1 Tax=Thiorhodococcus drewsii AZ1 TaxID=765913 RepID=G2DVE6_9GAMM|nr:signal recognition particle-docking protein FtsY [Thiorhodococcus drewsii]EGV33961.1 signal recognition particle-docking protein FtsY [Thiorhodococcus drewsii AZ1]
MFGFGKKNKAPDQPEKEPQSEPVAAPSAQAPAQEPTAEPEAPGKIKKPWFGKLFRSQPTPVADADAPPSKASPAETLPADPTSAKATQPATPTARPTPPPAPTPAPRPVEAKRPEPIKRKPEPAPSATPVEPPADDQPEVGKRGVFNRLRDRLTRTRTQLGDGLGNAFLGRKKIDDELMEELETLLITADLGVDSTSRIISDLAERVKRKSLSDPQALLKALKDELRDILRTADGPVRQPQPGRPQVILMVGINGAGKTTTIGKLAKRLQEEGNSVILAAGDTFRAAAVEQLETWGERNQIPVIAQHTGADSASVIFDALQAATARGADVLIADTAGRLHTKSNLMDELSKVARVLKKIDPEAPHEVMLVVDATTGQNALSQAEHFHRAVGITGITLTKLDGTAKGGILFGIADKLKVPIRFIGVGESIEDLRPFDPDEFLDALLG